MQKIASAAIATAIAASGLVAVAAPSQAATVHPMGCVDAGVHYSVTKHSTVWMASNIYSPWGSPGVGFTYSTSRTGTVTATGTATVSAEAGVIFAKASTSLSVSLAKSWSESRSWSIHYTVPKVHGKTLGRLMMFHEARKITVKKYTLNHFCNKSTTNWVKTFVVPLKSGNNATIKWGPQYR